MSVYPPTGTSAKEVWEYPARTLTQSKFPFWSAIISQASGSISVPGGPSSAYVTIQPPPGETWLVWIDFYISASWAGTAVKYCAFDGTNSYDHTAFYTGGSYGNFIPHIETAKVLTNSMYARLWGYNPNTDPSISIALYYGYSGFKLSQPLWSPKTSVEPRPWRRGKTKPLPATLAGLEKYAYDILGLDPARPNEYELGIVLEEDLPLAIDPITGFPVERLTICISADALAALIEKHKRGQLDLLKTPYRKYIERLRSEGINIV